MSMTLPERSCPTFGIPPGKKVEAFEDGDRVLGELDMLKLFINGFCCNCPKFPAIVPAENILPENGGFPPTSVPKAGVEITEGLTPGELKLDDPNILGLLFVLS